MLVLALVLVLRIITLVMILFKLPMFMPKLHAVASLFYFLYTSLKVSTHSVVLVPNTATGHCYLCSVFIIIL